MLNINYKPGIKKFLSDIAENFIIHRSGNDLLNRLLLNLNSKLINKSLDIAGDSSNVTATHARNAVEALFTGNLKDLAFAEGDKILTLYRNGLVEYKPEKKTFKRKKKKGKDLIVAAKEFTKGVSDLTSSIFPQASFPSKTTTVLCEILEEMAVNISDFLQEKGKDCIKQDDVKEAVVNLLPDQISKHAIAEGTKMILSYETERREKFARKKKRTSDTASLEFNRGVSYLTSLMFPQASILTESTEMVCEILEEMAVKISEFVQTKAKDCIKEKDVRDTIINLLPEQMSHHAIAEGARRTVLYESEMLDQFGRTRKTTVSAQRSKSRKTSGRRTKESSQKRKTERSAARTEKIGQKSASRITESTQKRKRKTMESPRIRKSTRTSASTQRPKRRRITESKQRPKIETRRRPKRFKSRKYTERTKKSKARTKKRTQKPKSKSMKRKRKRKTTESPEIQKDRTSASTQKLKKRKVTADKQKPKIRTSKSSEKRESRRITARIQKPKARTIKTTQKSKSSTTESRKKLKRRATESPDLYKSKTTSAGTQKFKRRKITVSKQPSKLRTEESSEKRESKITITQKPEKRKTSAISPLDFAQGVSNLTSLIFPQALLPAQSIETICKILEEITMKISDFVQRHARNYIKQKDVRDAIVNLLPDQLSYHAIAEGARITFLFKEGRQMKHDEFEKVRKTIVSTQRPRRGRSTVSKEKPKPRIRKSPKQSRSRSTARTKRRKARTTRSARKSKSRAVKRTQKQKRKITEGLEETYKSRSSTSTQSHKRRKARASKQRSKLRIRESSTKSKSRKFKARTPKPKAKTTVRTQISKERKISAVSQFDFAQGVSELTSLIFPEASLQAQTNENICDMLTEIALKISHFVQRKEEKFIKLKNVRSAIVSLFPDRMSGPAIAEGARMTMLYEIESL